MYRIEVVRCVASCRWRRLGWRCKRLGIGGRGLCFGFSRRSWWQSVHGAAMMLAHEVHIRLSWADVSSFVGSVDDIMVSHGCFVQRRQ